jgi:hypothetical protein
MERKGFIILPQQRSRDHLVKQLKKLKKDIAYFEQTYNGETVHWYIHRCNWPKPEEVNWKAHIVEILKAKQMIPVMEFDTWEHYPKVPGKLLNFIKQYTKYPSFESAVRDIPIVEIVYVDNDYSRPYMRLKEGNYKGTNQFSIQVLKQKGLTKEQINFLFADTSQNEPWLEMKFPTPKMFSSCLYSTIDHKKLTITDYSIPPSKDVKDQNTIEFIYTGAYNTWAPPNEKRKNEDNDTDQSLYEISSLYDNNSYQGDTDNENQI